jgi:pimeloyl-ACP methyl ester carboxylesterase
MRRRRRWPKLLLALATCLLAAAALVWWWSMPSRGDAFYQPPGDVPAGPGMLVRSEPYTHDIPAGARGWRILYTTRDAQDRPVLASALVVAPAQGSTPYPVIAWTHGTTGAVPGCGPLPLGLPFANVPAFPAAIEQGWAMVATDYAGMAAPGVAPYLVGLGEARSALDGLRAARQLKDVALSEETVVWGHSQGGHAALWTAAEWPRYAPDLRLLGVAAAAPATDLPQLLSRIAEEPVGRIMGAFVLRAYANTYPDVDFAAETRAATRPLVRDMAARCLAGKQALVSVVEALAVGGSIFVGAPTDGPFGARLRENIPPHLAGLPVWIAQGDRDTLVLPDVQRGYVRQWCAQGRPLEYREYEGDDHLSLVAAGKPYSRDLLAWTRDRFSRVAATGQCPQGVAPGSSTNG